DTHVKRVSYRLGLTRNKDPEKVEYDLMKVLPESHWIRFNQQIIHHGRKVCAARSPKCEGCALGGLCAERGK
ncbi:MAG: endonuclease III, partial [Clostridiales bacterium]|nr:endonuclease III [Clostridiales bacterium]